MRFAWWLAGGLLLAGCAGRSASTQPSGGPSVRTTAGGPAIIFEEVVPGTKIYPSDELRCLMMAVQITAPAGAISQNPEFQRAIAGQLGNDAYHEMLAGNGIRAGTMPVSGWDTVRKAMETAPDVMSQISTMRGPGRVELEAKSVAEQTLFYYDMAGHLHGRTFEASDNFWGLLFAPDPVQRGHIAVGITPVVRSSRRQMRVTRSGDDYGLDYVQPESLYDVGLNAVVPAGTVIVLAPNSKAIESATSLGRAFLMFDDHGTMIERIVFLYPKLYRFNSQATEKQFEEVLKRVEREGIRYHPPPDR